MLWEEKVLGAANAILNKVNKPVAAKMKDNIRNGILNFCPIN